MRINPIREVPTEGMCRRARLAWALAVLLPLATVAMQLDAPAAGAVPTGSSSSANDPVTQAFVRTVGAQAIGNQESLSVFRAWMSHQSGFAASGYVGTIDDLAHKATTIMWYGARTPLLSTFIAEGKRRGIAVSVQPRQHSLPQLDAAVDAIWQQEAAGQWAGFTISTIATIGATDDGITVSGTYTAVAAAQRAPQVQSLASAVMGVPVHVVPGVGATTSTGRDNDFAPFNAGGYMISTSSGHTCSSGFAIRINGTAHITTARHCNANDFHDRSASNAYGTGTINSTGGGGRVLSAIGSALAFDGAWNSDSFWKTVIGYEDLGVNDLVCTGGGNSGEHCNIKVTNLSVSFNDGSGSFSTIEGVQQTGGAIANMQGDSGGPVISLTSTSSGQVRAAGMIQGFTGAGKTGSACGAAFDVGSNQCSSNVLFSSMRTVVNSISGGSLLTG